MTLKLLLVGKDVNNFDSIKKAFENEDADIILATSIGLAIFLARKNQPHLVISQQELVDTDALSLFYELKNELELAHIPFALLLPKDDGSKASKTSAHKDMHFLQLESVNGLVEPTFIKEQIIRLINSQ